MTTCITFGLHTYSSIYSDESVSVSVSGVCGLLRFNPDSTKHLRLLAGDSVEGPCCPDCIMAISKVSCVFRLLMHIDLLLWSDPDGHPRQILPISLLERAWGKSPCLPPRRGTASKPSLLCHLSKHDWEQSPGLLGQVLQTHLHSLRICSRKQFLHLTPVENLLLLIDSFSHIWIGGFSGGESTLGTSGKYSCSIPLTSLMTSTSGRSCMT